MGMCSELTITKEELEKMFKNGTVTLDLSNEVDGMLNNWIKNAKILGEKDKVKEYKRLKKFMKKNK